MSSALMNKNIIFDKWSLRVFSFGFTIIWKNQVLWKSTCDEKKLNIYKSRSDFVSQIIPLGEILLIITHYIEENFPILPLQTITISVMLDKESCEENNRNLK